MVPTFRRIEKENLYLHITEFEDIVATFNANYAMEDIAHLKLFLFSLSDLRGDLYLGMSFQLILLPSLKVLWLGLTGLRADDM